MVSAVIFADTTLYSVVAPLLPRYVDTLGLSKSAAGMLVAAFPVGTLLASLPAGALVAKVGARPTVYLGLALMGVSSAGFGFAQHVVLLDVARFAQGVGAACSWAGGLAWLVESVPRERRGEAIGLALGAGVCGAIAGPVVGAVAEATAPRIVFSLVVVVALGLAAWAAMTPSPPLPSLQPSRAIRRALRRPPVLAGVWLVVLPSACAGAIGVLGPLRLDGLGFSGAAVGATFLVAAALQAAISPVIGRVVDRRGRLAPLPIGLATTTASLCLLTVPREAVVLAALVVATIAGIALFWTPAMVHLSEAAERAGLHQGYAFALMNLAWAAGFIVGAAGGGVTADRFGDGVAAGLVGSATAATLLATRHYSRRAWSPV
jgi:MFS family permease